MIARGALVRWLNGGSPILFDANPSYFGIQLADGTTVIIDPDGMHIFAPDCSKETILTSPDLVEVFKLLRGGGQSKLKVRDQHAHDKRQTSPQIAVNFGVYDQCKDPYPSWNPTLYVEKAVCPVSNDGIGGFAAVCALPYRTPRKECEENQKYQLDKFTGFDVMGGGKGGPKFTPTVLAGLAVAFPPLAPVIADIILTLTIFSLFQDLLKIYGDLLVSGVCLAFSADGWNVHVVGPPPRLLDVSLAFVTPATASSAVAGSVTVINPDIKKVTCGATTCVDLTTDRLNCGTCGNAVSVLNNLAGSLCG